MKTNLRHWTTNLSTICCQPWISVVIKAKVLAGNMTHFSLKSNRTFLSETHHHFWSNFHLSELLLLPLVPSIFTVRFSLSSACCQSCTHRALLFFSTSPSFPGNLLHCSSPPSFLHLPSPSSPSLPSLTFPNTALCERNVSWWQKKGRMTVLTLCKMAVIRQTRTIQCLSVEAKDWYQTLWNKHFKTWSSPPTC